MANSHVIGFQLSLCAVCGLVLAKSTRYFEPFREYTIIVTTIGQLAVCGWVCVLCVHVSVGLVSIHGSLDVNLFNFRPVVRA